MANNPRFPMVESLRGLAALSVVLYHVGKYTGGGSLGGFGRFVEHLNIGVPLFFVISGFLLYRPFVSARLLGTKEIRTRPYLVRRARRILPAYWVALTVLALAFPLPDVFTGDWWRYYGLVQIYDVHTFDLGMAVAWTLCIEVTFYLALPLIDRAVRALQRALPERRPGSIDLVFVGAGAVLSLGVQLGVHIAGWDPRVPQNLLGTFHWFAGGMVIAVLTVTRPRISVRAATASWAAAVALFVGVSWIPNEGALTWYQLLGTHVGYGIVSVLFFLPAVAIENGIAARVLTLSALRWLGLISYSIYLYHATLIPPLVERHAGSVIPGNAWISTTVCALIVIIPTAAVSYYLIEAPAMKYRFRGFRRAKPSPVKA
jgi:peptidoglycan/LPS O-acetylase OafA/YrhL